MNTTFQRSVLVWRRYPYHYDIFWLICATKTNVGTSRFFHTVCTVHQKLYRTCLTADKIAWLIALAYPK